MRSIQTLGSGSKPSWILFIDSKAAPHQKVRLRERSERHLRDDENTLILLCDARTKILGAGSRGPEMKRHCVNERIRSIHSSGDPNEQAHPIVNSAIRVLLSERLR
jgi:hypothetical protein